MWINNIFYIALCISEIHNLLYDCFVKAGKLNVEIRAKNVIVSSPVRF